MISRNNNCSTFIWNHVIIGITGVQKSLIFAPKLSILALVASCVIFLKKSQSHHLMQNFLLYRIRCTRMSAAQVSANKRYEHEQTCIHANSCMHLHGCTHACPQAVFSMWCICWKLSSRHSSAAYSVEEKILHQMMWLWFFQKNHTWSNQGQDR